MIFKRNTGVSLPEPDTGLYAVPREVASQKDCRFYHSMTLPGVGEITGDWDLRPTIEQYFGGVEFGGKRALDVGTASGFLTWEMEKRGADVVSFDIGEKQEWDVVPHADVSLTKEKAGRSGSRDALLNSYWFAHAANGSSANAYYGDIYDLPYELGAFDVAILGTVLSHLRDPFQAIESASKLIPVGGELIIVDGYIDAEHAIQRLIPTPENGVRFAWWRASTGMVKQMLSVLGFGEPRMAAAEHLQVVGFDQPKPIDLMTYVATREQPWVR